VVTIKQNMSSTAPTASPTATIYLPYHDRRRSDRAVVLIDVDCWAHLQQYHWVVLEDKETGEPSYVVCDLQSAHPRSMHRECYIRRHGEIPAGLVIDHANRVRTDCRTANLRACTKSENACNRRKPVKKHGNSSSKYKGVWRKKARVLKNGLIRAEKKPFVCEVRVKAQKRKHTSCHADEKDAARKYNAVASEWMGKYALLNVISDDEGDDQTNKESPVCESEVSQ
jgi:hypothetical protein